MRWQNGSWKSPWNSRSQDQTSCWRLAARTSAPRIHGRTMPGCLPRRGQGGVWPRQGAGVAGSEAGVEATGRIGHEVDGSGSGCGAAWPNRCWDGRNPACANCCVPSVKGKSIRPCAGPCRWIPTHEVLPLAALHACRSTICVILCGTLWTMAGVRAASGPPRPICSKSCAGVPAASRAGHAARRLSPGRFHPWQTAA